MLYDQISTTDWITAATTIATGLGTALAIARRGVDRLR
jgi:hypothetical protein